MIAGARAGTYRPITIADGVRTSARRTPDKLAIEHGEARRTYAQLVERIDRVSAAAHHGLGLRPGDHAAVMSTNCIEFIEIVLGLASVGVAPAMINARSAPARRPPSPTTPARVRCSSTPTSRSAGARQSSPRWSASS